MKAPRRLFPSHYSGVIATARDAYERGRKLAESRPDAPRPAPPDDCGYTVADLAAWNRGYDDGLLQAKIASGYGMATVIW